MRENIQKQNSLSLSEQPQIDIKDFVRAILQAMREPSEGMLRAGGYATDFDERITEEDYARCFLGPWQAAIDHLLAEQDP